MLEARQYRIGHFAYASLQRQQTLGQALFGHFFFQEIQNVAGNGRGFRIRARNVSRTVVATGKHNAHNFIDVQRNGAAANFVVHSHHRNHVAVRVVFGHVNIVYAQHIQRHRLVDFQNHFVSQGREARAVAHRRGWNQAAVFFNAGHFQYRQIHFDGAVVQQFSRFAQMLVDEQHFALVDFAAQSGVHLERHAFFQGARSGQFAIGTVAQRSACHQSNLYVFAHRAFCKCGQHLFAVACFGETARTDHHAVFKQLCGFCRRHDFV